MPRRQPCVPQPRHHVDHRPPVRVPRPEAAPLVGHADAAQAWQHSGQAADDGVDDVRLNRGTLVAEIERSPGQQLAVLNLGRQRRDDAGKNDVRPLRHQQVALDPVGRDTQLQAVEHRRPAGGEHHGTGPDLTSRRAHAHDAVTADLDRCRGDAGGDSGQPGGQPGDRAERVDPGLAVDQRALHRPGQSGDELFYLTGIQPLDAARLMGRITAVVRRQPEPVQLDQANPARDRRLQVMPALQSGALQVDERLRVAPLMGLGDKQPGCAAGRAGAEPAGLDQQDVAEAGLRARGCGGHAQDAAADHQHVGSGIRDNAVSPAEHGPLRCGELITPDGAVHGHVTHPGSSSRVAGLIAVCGRPHARCQPVHRRRQWPHRRPPAAEQLPATPSGPKRGNQAFAARNRPPAAWPHGARARVPGQAQYCPDRA